MDDRHEPGDEPPTPSGDEDRGSAPEAPPPSPELFVRFGLVFYGLLAAAAVVWRMGWQGAPLWTAVPLTVGTSPAWGRDLGLGVGCGVALLAISEWTTRRTAWGERLARSLAEALGPLSVPNALLLATASGLAEELFFRGALQPVAGLVVASLLFGAVHFVPRRELAPWSLFAVLAGFLFGFLYQWTGSLTAPVVAHTVVNGVNLPRLVREYGSGSVSRRAR